MWPLVSAPESKNQLTLDEAWLYCVCLYHNGYSDWRMPTYPEYLSIGWLPDNCWDQTDWNNFVNPSKISRHLDDHLQFITPVRYNG